MAIVLIAGVTTTVIAILGNNKPSSSETTEKSAAEQIEIGKSKLTEGDKLENERNPAAALKSYEASLAAFEAAKDEEGKINAQMKIRFMQLAIDVKKEADELAAKEKAANHQIETYPKAE